MDISGQTNRGLEDDDEEEAAKTLQKDNEGKTVAKNLLGIYTNADQEEEKKPKKKGVKKGKREDGFCSFIYLHV